MRRFFYLSAAAVIAMMSFNACGLFGGGSKDDLTDTIYTATEVETHNDGTYGGTLARDIYEEEILAAQGGVESGKYSLLSDQLSDSFAIASAIAGAEIAKKRVLEEDLIDGQTHYVVYEMNNPDSADFIIQISISSLFGYSIPVKHGFRYVRMEPVTYEQPEAVDLGVDVLWGSCNVGASNPEGFGGFYAWGETEQKETYTWENYKWGDGTNFTKYFAGVGPNILDSQDDAASVNLTNGWRTPKYYEVEQLINNCTWTIEELNGVRGYRVTGKNGNSIFIPMAGCKGEIGINTNFGWYGNYHTANVYTYKVGYTYYLRFHGSGQFVFTDEAYTALPIRPVKDK